MENVDRLNLMEKSSLSQISLAINNLITKIKDVSLNINVEKSKLILHNFVLSTTTGNFLINGYIDLSDIAMPSFNINISSADKKNPSLRINYSLPTTKIVGDLLIKRLELSGSSSSMLVSGDVTADNYLIQIGINKTQ